MTDLEQFEAWWFASKYCQVVVARRMRQQIAWDAWQQIAWDAWQAARAAPVCDPTATQCPRCNNPNGPVLGECDFRAAPAQRDLTVPEEKAIDAALFASVKRAAPAQSRDRELLIKILEQYYIVGGPFPADRMKDIVEDAGIYLPGYGK